MAKAIKRKRGELGAVFVDYLQLLKPDSTKMRSSRENDVAQIARSIKEMSGTLDCPVFALAQLNRQVDGRADRWPRLSDLRESGEIEQSADNILFIHNEDAEKRNADKEAMKSYPSENVVDNVNIIFGKVRGGATGVVELTFTPRYGVFE
jgi:replicative DNA helicase